jgi:biopolymer transport protein ExbD
VAGTDQPQRERPQADDPDRPVPRRRRRAGIRIDMTPMVDIAFLLLIFFMVTTVFRRPLAMEVNVPEPGAKVEVPESNVLTIWIDEAGSLFRRLGTGPMATMSWRDLDPLLRDSAAANPELVVLVKIDRDARYERMVDMLDILDEAHMDRFSLVAMTPADAELVGGARAAGGDEAGGDATSGADETGGAP